MVAFPYLFRDRESFCIDLTVATAFGTSLCSQARTYCSFAELAAEQLEIVVLVSGGYRVQMVFELVSPQTGSRSIFATGLIFGARTAHKIRWLEDAIAHGGYAFLEHGAYKAHEFASS